MAATAASSEKTPGCMDQGWMPPKWIKMAGEIIRNDAHLWIRAQTVDRKQLSCKPLSPPPSVCPS